MDRFSISAGSAFMLLGVVLLLDESGIADLGFAWLAPAVIAVVGVVLLAAGLGRPPRS
jgi:membrane protein implicated in regulation of membrane protease activity